MLGWPISTWGSPWTPAWVGPVSSSSNILSTTSCKWSGMWGLKKRLVDFIRKKYWRWKFENWGYFKLWLNWPKLCFFFLRFYNSIASIFQPILYSSLSLSVPDPIDHLVWRGRDLRDGAGDLRQGPPDLPASGSGAAAPFSCGGKYRLRYRRSSRRDHCEIWIERPEMIESSHLLILLLNGEIGSCISDINAFKLCYRYTLAFYMQ